MRIEENSWIGADKYEICIDNFNNMYNSVLFVGYDIKIQSRNKKVGKNSGNRRCQKLEIQWVIRMKIGDMREFIKNLDDNTEIEFEYHGKKMKIVKKRYKGISITCRRIFQNWVRFCI